jgi:hypothetical protein
MQRIHCLAISLLLSLAPASAAAQQSEVDKIRAEFRRESLRELERGNPKQQVEAASRLDAQDADKVVPVLSRHLQSPDAALRLAAANTYWDLIARKPEAWEAARPSLLAALQDADGAVAMYAAGALTALKTAPDVLLPARRRVLREGHPRAYVRYLAARNLIGVEPGPVVVEPLLDYLEETATAARRGGSRDNVQLARGSLERLADTGDRTVLPAMGARLERSVAVAPVLLRVMNRYKPKPDRWTESLLSFASSADKETVEAAWSVMGDQKDAASLALWAPRAASMLSTAAGRDLAMSPLWHAAGRTAAGLPELSALAFDPAASEAHRLRAIEILGRAADAENRDQVPEARLMARERYLKTCENTLATGRKDAYFSACAQPLTYAVRDDKERAAMLARWLASNNDPAAKIAFLESLESLWRNAFEATDVVRAHLAHADPRVKQAAEKALDRIRPAWRESAAREARQPGTAPAIATAPAKSAKPTAAADGAALYGAIRLGDLAAVKKLVNAGNVNASVRYPQLQGTPPVPLTIAINYCGIPSLSGAQLAAIVAHMISLGADPEARDQHGENLFDRAKSACPPEVLKAMGG